jgi:hypothetical protein
MSTRALRRTDAVSMQIRTVRTRRDPSEEYAALWAMTRTERIAAMWRSELTSRQLCQWSSRAQHEVPILGGELAWIVMHTPEWAEATNELAAKSRPSDNPEVDR